MSFQYKHARHDEGHRGAWIALGSLAVVGVLGAGYLARRAATEPQHPPDSAPGRTARQRRFGGYAVVGKTVTIDRPRDELYRFWRDFANLPQFMENVVSVEESDDRTRWQIKAPFGTQVTVETRIVEERENESIAWRSVEGSQVETEGKVMFRDAPGDRGTEVEAIIAYRPPAGELGRLIAKLFSREPQAQGRRELKRLKMLMETGEIATARNRNDQA